MVAAPFYMRNFISSLLKIVAVILISGGVWMFYKSGSLTLRATAPKVEDDSQLSAHAKMLRKHLLKYSAPQKIQINNLTQRLSNDVEEIKKIKIFLKPDAVFYISIDLFTDENDPVAPLVAQIQFFDIKTENKINAIFILYSIIDM